MYTPNIGTLQYIRQTLTDIKGEIESNTIIVGDFNTPPIPMNRSSKQKINKETCLKWYIRQHSLISSGHAIKIQKNIPSSQLHMGHSPG